jgi:hypothetical protein
MEGRVKGTEKAGGRSTLKKLIFCLDNPDHFSGSAAGCSQKNCLDFPKSGDVRAGIA